MTFKPTTFVLPFILLAALTSSLFAETVKAPSAAEISQLVAQLGDDDCMVRDNAQDVLTTYGGAIKSELEKALASAEDPEIYQRLQFILKTIPLVWDEPGDEPELTAFIQDYRRANHLAKMVILEQLRRLPFDIQIKALDRIFQKEQNAGSALFAAMAFWYWRPEADSPQYAQFTQTVNNAWKDSKNPAVKNLYYLVNYKQLRAEATIWFDNQLHNMAELNRTPSRAVELIPDFVGSILTEFARRNAESLLTDDDLAGEKRINFPAPRYGYSSIVIVNGVAQPQFSIRSQILSSLRNSNSSVIVSSASVIVPLLGPIYMFHQGMSKDAEAWLKWELSNQLNLNRKSFAEILHEYDLNKTAADVLEQKYLNSSAANKDSVLNLSTEEKGLLWYYRACQAMQENQPDKQWEFLCESIKANKNELDSWIMQWELCQIPSEENKIAAITDEVRKQIDDKIEKLLDEMDKDIVNNGMDSPSRRNSYAWLAAKTNRYLDKALNYANEAVNSESTSSACIDTLAHCYAANGNLDKAIELQQKAVNLEPISQILYNNLLKFKQLKETVGNRQ